MARALHPLLAVLFAALAALLWPARASAIDRTFAGSAQLDYLFVPTEKGANAHGIGFDGFTTEASLKLGVDISDSLSANVKICYGCHGFEADMAYFDYRVADELNFRFGRFSPSFGAFNLRHDPANHGLSDKPLPYDMGRMLRRITWNNGVLPSPFPDNGLEIDGTHWFGERAQLDYAAYAVTGFKAQRDAFDLDFVQSRSPSLYYTDNNGRPTVGGRAALTIKMGERTDMTLGASGMYGAFDPDNHLTYTIVGADLSLRLGQTNVRAEYLVRRQEFDTSDPTRFKYPVVLSNGDFFTKHGAYLELEQPLSPRVGILARVDGMYRAGNVAKTSDLSKTSSVGRATLGATINVERGLRLKMSTELWDFSDQDASGKTVEVGMHFGAVGTF
jgi:hypothetical protein